jgi:hypothetical protein
MKIATAVIQIALLCIGTWAIVMLLHKGPLSVLERWLKYVRMTWYCAEHGARVGWGAAVAYREKAWRRAWEAALPDEFRIVKNRISEPRRLQEIAPREPQSMEIPAYWQGN